MIDIHCHILPGVDDGADTIEDALDMAQMASESGVKEIIATPHTCVPVFLPNYKSISLLDGFKRLSDEIKNAKIPLEIYTGAEILCTKDMPKLLEQGKLLTLASSNYILVEFYFDADPEYIDSMLDIVQSYGLVPVIAHPERYYAVQDHPYMVEEWNDKGYVIQLNKGSVSGWFGHRTQRAARWMLSNGFVHVIASDAHDIDKRTPTMKRVREYLEDELVYKYVELLFDENPKRIISNMPIISIRDKMRSNIF